MRHLFAKGCPGVRHSIILSKIGTFLKNEKLPYYTSKGLTLRKEHMCSRLSFLKFSSHWKLARAPPPPQKFYLWLVLNGQRRIEAGSEYGVGRLLRQKGLEGLIETFKSQLTFISKKRCHFCLNGEALSQ